MEKTCFKCNEIKPLHFFYKHSAMKDGYLNKCKECNKKDSIEHRSKNLDAVRAYDRERGKSPERLKLAAEQTKRWRAEDRRRGVAHNAVARAIKNGSLVRESCKRCNEEKSEAHHENYDMPLDVVWLCSKCHKQRHKELLAL